MKDIDPEALKEAKHAFLRIDEPDPDPHKFYEWIVKIRVSATLVADGINLTNERMHDIMCRGVSYSYEREIETEVISAPSDAAIAHEQGFKNEKDPYFRYRSGM